MAPGAHRQCRGLSSYPLPEGTSHPPHPPPHFYLFIDPCPGKTLRYRPQIPISCFALQLLMAAAIDAGKRQRAVVGAGAGECWNEAGRRGGWGLCERRLAAAARRKRSALGKKKRKSPWQRRMPFFPSISSTRKHSEQISAESACDLCQIDAFLAQCRGRASFSSSTI